MPNTTFDPNLAIDPSWLKRWKWRVGIPADLWIIREREIGKFIKQNALKPVPARHFLTKPTDDNTRSFYHMIDIDSITGIHGGRKIPHLHYKGALYLLDRKSWRKFSADILKDFSNQLSQPNTVPFESFMEITDTLNRNMP